VPRAIAAILKLILQTPDHAFVLDCASTFFTSFKGWTTPSPSIRWTDGETAQSSRAWRPPLLGLECFSASIRDN
jgi:hypothetical protein